jgi:hypothetical protein
VAGDAHPEADEEIDFRLVKLSEVLKMIEKGAIKDGKTLTSVLLYARIHGVKRQEIGRLSRGKWPLVHGVSCESRSVSSRIKLKAVSHFVDLARKNRSTFPPILAS